MDFSILPLYVPLDFFFDKSMANMEGPSSSMALFFIDYKLIFKII